MKVSRVKYTQFNKLVRPAILLAIILLHAVFILTANANELTISEGGLVVIADQENKTSDSFPGYSINNEIHEANSLPENFYPYIHNTGEHSGYKGVLLYPANSSYHGTTLGFLQSGHTATVTLSVLSVGDELKQKRQGFLDNLSELYSQAKSRPGEVISMDSLSPSLSKTPDFDEILYINSASMWKAMTQLKETPPHEERSTKRLVILDDSENPVTISTPYKVPSHLSVTFAGMNQNQTPSRATIKRQNKKNDAAIECKGSQCRFYNIVFEWKPGKKRQPALLFSGIEAGAGTYDLFSIEQSRLDTVPENISSDATLTLFARNHFSTPPLEHLHDFLDTEKNALPVQKNGDENQLVQFMEEATQNLRSILPPLLFCSIPGVIGQTTSTMDSSIDPVKTTTFCMLGVTGLVMSFIVYTLFDAACALHGNKRFSYVYHLGRCMSATYRNCRKSPQVQQGDSAKSTNRLPTIKEESIIITTTNV